jgi:hypothetical protein
MLAKDTASTNVKDSRFVRYAAFCTVWFVAVPLAGAFLVVWLLSMPEADPASSGFWGGLRAFGREQPVPVCIIAFTLSWPSGPKEAAPSRGGTRGRRRPIRPSSALRRKFEDAAGLSTDRSDPRATPP